MGLQHMQPRAREGSRTGSKCCGVMLGGDLTASGALGALAAVKVICPRQPAQGSSQAPDGVHWNTGGRAARPDGFLQAARSVLCAGRLLAGHAGKGHAAGAARRTAAGCRESARLGLEKYVSSANQGHVLAFSYGHVPP